jgi:hypothetical protein
MKQGIRALILPTRDRWVIDGPLPNRRAQAVSNRVLARRHTLLIEAVGRGLSVLPRLAGLERNSASLVNYVINDLLLSSNTPEMI